MKKIVLLTLSAIAMLTAVGCDKKDDKGNNYGYGYGRDGYGYGRGYGYADRNCFANDRGYNDRYDRRYDDRYDRRTNNRYDSRYNSRYDSRYNDSRYASNRYGYGAGRYQFVNGDCIDTQTDRIAPAQRCERNYDSGRNSYRGYSNSCRYFGGNPNGQWGVPNNTACAIYDRPGEQFFPIYYPETGQTVCMGFSTFNNFSMTYGSPLYWNNMNGVYWGCTPGVTTSCNCRNFGGTLGWVSGGVSVGWCY